MTELASPLYQPDTNILVHSIRQDATGAFIRTSYGLLMQEKRPIISVVTEGEIRSLAYQFGWGADKTEQMKFLLGYFGHAPLDTPAIMEAYALIDSYSERIGHTMGKNDCGLPRPLMSTARFF